MVDYIITHPINSYEPRNAFNWVFTKFFKSDNYHEFNKNIMNIFTGKLDKFPIKF